jgi:hypothetical protein
VARVARLVAAVGDRYSNHLAMRNPTVRAVVTGAALLSFGLGACSSNGDGGSADGGTGGSRTGGQSAGTGGGSGAAGGISGQSGGTDAGGPETSTDAGPPLTNATCLQIRACASSCTDAPCVQRCMDMGSPAGRMLHAQLQMCSITACPDQDRPCRCEAECIFPGPCADLEDMCTEGMIDKDPYCVPGCF